MTPEQRFLANLDRLDRLVAVTCRRHGLGGADAEDFAQSVRLKLVADDYAVLRSYSGRVPIDGFLAIVVANAIRDFRIARWGKWRPSAAALRLGSPALELEVLIHRDSRSFDEAVEILRRNHGVTTPTAVLADLAAELPGRSGRRLIGEDEAAVEAIAGPAAADERLAATEQAAAKTQALSALGRALASLPALDALILRMRFGDGFTVKEIASALSLPQRPLYRQIERLLAALRHTLEKAGVDAAEVLASLGTDASVADDAGRAPPGTARRGGS